MADEKKKISLGGIDNAAEEKGSFIKTVWQFVKFLVVSGLVTIIQLVLANVLPLIFDSVTATLPGFLQGIFKPDVIFDASTAQGAKQIAKYVVGGVVTWGYLLPFFLSNLIANIYGFYQNKKTSKMRIKRTSGPFLLFLTGSLNSFSSNISLGAGFSSS